MYELQLAGPIGHLELKLDRLAGEALADAGLGEREGFVRDDLRNRFADYLLGRKTNPLRKGNCSGLEAIRVAKQSCAAN